MYRCREHFERFERLVRPAPAAAPNGADRSSLAIVCPACASAEVERLLLVFARTALACALAPGGG